MARHQKSNLEIDLRIAIFDFLYYLIQLKNLLVCPLQNQVHRNDILYWFANGHTIYKEYGISLLLGFQMHLFTLMYKFQELIWIYNLHLLMVKARGA